MITSCTNCIGETPCDRCDKVDKEWYRVKVVYNNREVKLDLNKEFEEDRSTPTAIYLSFSGGLKE